MLCVMAAHNKRVQGAQIQGKISPFSGFKARLRARLQTKRMSVRFLDTALPEQLDSVWLLNDSRNKKERVSAVLENVAGLTWREAETVMMQVSLLDLMRKCMLFDAGHAARCKLVCYLKNYCLLFEAGGGVVSW